MNLNEALDILEENGFEVIKEGIIGKTLAAGALATGLAFGNSGVKAKPVVDDTFGKNQTVHLQTRHDFDSDRFGVPTNFKLKSGKKLKVMDIDKEIELTKQKILATPDSVFKEYGKKHIDKISRLITNAANRYNLDVDILLAIACIESNFDNAATSGKKAKGIMQMTKVAAEDVHNRISGLDSAQFDFTTFAGLEKNIYSAAKLVSDLSVRRNNVVEMIFATYNGGTAQATQYRYFRQGKPNKLTTETRNYVRKCLQMYKYYKKIEPKS